MNSEKTGKLIAEKRREKNMTQKQLAEMLYVSDKAVSRWETGRGFPEITILEELAAALDISTAELIKGECIDQPLAAEEVRKMTEGSLDMFRKIMRRKQVKDLIIGSLASAAVLVTAFVHLNSPYYLTDPGDAVYTETLSGGQIVAVTEVPAPGWDTDLVIDPDTGNKTVFISCYDTLLSRLTHRSKPFVHILADADEIDAVYYYPTGTEDRLLYRAEDSGISQLPAGVVTLPRLLYNMYIFMGTILSVFGIIAVLLSRRKYYARRIQKAAAVPVILTLSMTAVLIGKTDRVCNAEYYLSGILLLSAILYILFLFLLERQRKKAS